LIPGLGTTEIFVAICGERVGLARGRGDGLLWGGAGPRPRADLAAEDAEALCEQFISSEVAGVFFAPFEHTARRDEVNRDLAEKLRRAGIAVVLLDRDLGAFPARSEFDCPLPHGKRTRCTVRNRSRTDQDPRTSIFCPITLDRQPWWPHHDDGPQVVQSQGRTSITISTRPGQAGKRSGR
jgi:hypothetical protein